MEINVPNTVGASRVDIEYTEVSQNSIM